MSPGYSEPMVKTSLCLSVLIALVVALSSCGKADVKKSSGQIVAKVNGDEISVHQINSAMARGNDIPPDEAKQASAQTLERRSEERRVGKECRSRWSPY